MLRDVSMKNDDLAGYVINPYQQQFNDLEVSDGRLISFSVDSGISSNVILTYVSLTIFVHENEEVQDESGQD